MKYRKKPDSPPPPMFVEMKVWRKHGDHWKVKRGVFSHQGGTDCKQCGVSIDVHGIIWQPKGYRPVGCHPDSYHIVCPGDCVVKVGRGKYYPCKPDIFEATYEKVDD